MRRVHRLQRYSNEMRGLTDGEIGLCRRVFPEPLPYREVRLCDGPAVNDAAERAFLNGNTAITLRRTIYLKMLYCRDFSAPEVGASARRLLVHEMTHVWQWQKLGVLRFLLRYAGDFLSCRGNAGSMYRYEQDPRAFARCRLEAQAEMVGDYQDPLHPNRATIEAKLKGTGLYGL